MQREPHETIIEHGPTAVRIGWWISFLATLALIFGLGVAKSAQAMTLTGPHGALPAVVLTDPEEEEGEEAWEYLSEEDWEYVECGGEEECEQDWEYEECGGEEEDEEERLECEEEEFEEATPSECLLSSAVATVSAIPARDTVRLAVRYTAHSPAAVNIGIRLRGSKGALSLGVDQRRLKRTGVYRQTERLSETQMKKVVAAKDFTIELGAVNTPRYCHSYFDRHLTVRRASGAGLTWSEPAARQSSGA